MNLVIDSSTLVAALVDSSATGRWAESMLSAHELAAPELVLVESTNILRRLELAGEIARLEASTARLDLLHLQIDLLPFMPFADRIWELRSNLTSYDAWYVAVAESLELPLATLDRALSRASGPTCEFRLPG